MTFGKFNVEYEGRIYNPERMREYRLKRSHEMMKKHKLGSMLIMEFDNQQYFGWHSRRGWMRHRLGGEFLLLVKDQGFPYCPAAYSGRGDYVAQMPWYKGKSVLHGAPFQSGIDINTKFNTERFDEEVKQVKELLKQHKVLDEPCGVDVTVMNMVEAYRRGGINLVSGLEAMAEARMIKNEDEIECTRTAGSIVDAAFWEVATKTKPGMTELNVAGIAAKACYDGGAEDLEGPSFVVHSGPRTGWNMPRTASDRMIRPGDMLVMDINGVGFEGYRTCFYRTFCVGAKPTEFQKEIYQDAVDCQVAMETSIKPGLSNQQIAKNIMKIGEGRWYNGPTFPKPGKYWTTGYGGHELGLTSGDLGPGWGGLNRPNIPMAKGRVLAVEVGCSAWDGQKWSYDGAKTENVVAVTSDTLPGEVLWRFPYKDGLMTIGMPGLYI